MKQNLHSEIGRAFEQELLKIFPKLKRHSSHSSIDPDFFYPPENALIEAKVAYGGHAYDSQTGNFLTSPSSAYAYGVQIKEYQVQGFQSYIDSGKPVLYLLGFHGIANSHKRYYSYTKQHERSEFISREFIVPSLYVVSASIVSQIFLKEKRLSKKAQNFLCTQKNIPPSLPKRYCSIKPRLLNTLIGAITPPFEKESVILRENTFVEPLTYYGLKRTNIHAQPLGAIQSKYRFSTKSGTYPVQIGCMVAEPDLRAYRSLFQLC